MNYVCWPLISSWASIGALVTVLVLALDPFFQQLLRISNRIVYQDSPPLILQRALDVSGLGPSTSNSSISSLVVFSSCYVLFQIILSLSWRSFQWHKRRSMTPLSKPSTRQSLPRAQYRITSRLVQPVTAFGLNSLPWASAQVAKTSLNKWNRALLPYRLRSSSNGNKKV